MYIRNNTYSIFYGILCNVVIQTHAHLKGTDESEQNTHTHSLDVSVLFSEALVSPGLLPASTVDRQSHQVNIHIIEL